MAVMPPLVSEHILSRVPPVFTVAPLVVPVMVEINGVEAQDRFPQEYPQANLRGRPMVKYHPDYNLLPEGELYPGLRETRAIITDVFKKAAAGLMTERKAYEIQAKT